MIITVSGSPGTGTSTLSRILSKELDLRWVNSGELFRKIASDRGISLRELGRIAEESPEVDYLIDDAQRAMAKDAGGVFEGRLSGHVLDANLKILLKADRMVRAERIASREEKLVEDAIQESRVREECPAQAVNQSPSSSTQRRAAVDLEPILQLSGLQSVRIPAG